MKHAGVYVSWFGGTVPHQIACYPSQTVSSWGQGTSPDVGCWSFYTYIATCKGPKGDNWRCVVPDFELVILGDDLSYQMGSQKISYSWWAREFPCLTHDLLHIQFGSKSAAIKDIFLRKLIWHFHWYRQKYSVCCCTSLYWYRLYIYLAFQSVVYATPADAQVYDMYHIRHQPVGSTWRPMSGPDLSGIATLQCQGATGEAWTVLLPLVIGSVP